jgi:hypothetical protein
MAGTLKIEVSGETKEELRRQLEDVIRELDKINFRPGTRINLSGPQAWKTVAGPQAWKTVASPQAWKTVAGPQAWKTAAGLHPSLAIGKIAPNNPGSVRAWTVTYET